ncbi:MAG TPA: hypothetical protein VLF19_13055 [Methylomirabilota bacterium]|nr:hypothetical protein [Methylomirabilota bacterium]
MDPVTAVDARLEVLRGRPIDSDPTRVRFCSLASLRRTLGLHFAVEEIVVRGGAARGRVVR